METLAGDIRSTLARRLRATTELGEADCSDLESLPWRIETRPSRTDIAVVGTRPTHCCLVIEGFTIREQMMKDGARQIQAINVPGDIPDLHSLFLKEMDHTFGTLSACTLAFVPHGALWTLCFEKPSIGSALWRETLIDAAQFRASITRASQLSASERIAHLLSEMELRLKAVGLSEDGNFQFPVTQEELGDFLGISTVQTNRSLQELRAEALISVNRHEIRILDRDRLHRLADFDPAYLHLSPRS